MMVYLLRRNIIFNADPDALAIKSRKIINMKTLDVHDRTKNDFWTMEAKFDFIETDFKEAYEFLYPFFLIFRSSLDVIKRNGKSLKSIMKARLELRDIVWCYAQRKEYFQEHHDICERCWRQWKK